MKFEKGFSLFFVMIFGFLIIGCYPKEKIIKNEITSNYKQKEFRSFSPTKSSNLAKIEPFDALQLYINGVEKRYQSNKVKIEKLQENNVIENNREKLDFQKELYYLNKRNVSLKAQIATSKNLKSSDLNQLRIDLDLEMDQIDKLLLAIESIRD
ncbi:hypothetical protein EF405_05985 [Cyclobacteriaceae bacterium YHN15]|nr:hypothetical protein EF405_05985 [Cyclobacteriaceae bacterium YHN15]